MNEAFTFYGSFYDAIKELDDADRLAVYDAICSYAITGEVPELTGVAAMAFKLMRPNIDANLQKRAAGKKGGESKPEADAKQTASKSEASANQQNITEQNKTKTKQNKSKVHARFVPPTEEEVVQYVQEKGIPIDAVKFYNHYASQDWRKSNGQKVTDWKRCLVTWQHNGKDAKAPPGKTEYHNRYNDFPQRDNDYEKIQEEWIRKSFGAPLPVAGRS